MKLSKKLTKPPLFNFKLPNHDLKASIHLRTETLQIQGNKYQQEQKAFKRIENGLTVY